MHFNADPADYESQSVTLTLQPGQVRLPVSVTILNDSIVEGNETFFALLDNIGQPITISSAGGVATVVIVEDSDDSMRMIIVSLKEWSPNVWVITPYSSKYAEKSHCNM